MSSRIVQPDTNPLTKRKLGEGYIVGTSAVLASVLLGVLVLDGPPLVWIVLGLIPAAAPVGVVYWLHQLDLDADGVWFVAKCAAFGIGIITLVFLGTHLSVQWFAVSTELTVVLTTAIAATAVGGTFVGVSIELRRSAEQLSLRNAVLHRVIRHNLRNDMTVVLAHLNDVESSVDGPEREKLEAAEQKITGLIDLTDKVRQLNVTSGGQIDTTVDLTALVDERVTHLRRTYPGLELETDLPDTAPVYAEEQFQLAIDNVVESAITHNSDQPELRIGCEVRRDTVVLGVEDDGHTIPDNDLTALATETETDLNHGYGVELWLVYWLTERNNGDVTVETDAESRRIEIALRRAQT